MSLVQVIILAVVQGLAELLPVSSSAHVVVAEKLMGLDPSDPRMTLLLVMLHTGTMFAVIAYFWKQWKQTYFSSADAFKRVAVRVIWATLLTGVIGLILKKIVEKTMFHGAPKAEIEELFGRLDLIAPALFCVGVLILIAGLRERKLNRRSYRPARHAHIRPARGCIRLPRGPGGAALAFQLARARPLVAFRRVLCSRQRGGLVPTLRQRLLAARKGEACSIPRS
jgi:undecaprenyl pyrophosphate phosphatase UppP